MLIKENELFTYYNRLMRGVLFCSFLILFSTASANTYFVAPDGNDNNPGTIERPWKTWGKAFNASLRPGDTVYFRGGVYYKDLSEGRSSWYYPDRDLQKGTGYKISTDGTKDNYIHYYAYPPDLEEGNRPVLDCINAFNDESTLNYGIRTRHVDYVKFYGLTIRNVNYYDIDINTECTGWTIDGTGTIIENCIIYNVDGQGFRISEGYDFHVINCDAYNIASPQENPPGERGSGFTSVNAGSGGSVYFKNCRAWKCSDQGFTAYSASYVKWDGCWSFHNGSLDAGGHGYKLGFPPAGSQSQPLKREVVNCIAAFNRASGFTTNDQNYIALEMHLYNNTSYHNGYYPGWTTPVSGFVIYNTSSSDEKELRRELINNISYDNEDDYAFIGRNAVYTHEHNSWDNPPGINITDADFLSLDSAGLAGPRRSDGTLPDIDFLKLAPGSSLRDAGTNVGLPYAGDSPALGAREYTEPGSNLHPAVKITSPADNSSFNSPANINFTVAASDADGTIRKVEIFNGSTKIDEKTSAPWTFRWNNVQAGSYSIRAVATDNEGTSSTSIPVDIIVEDEPGWKSSQDMIVLYPNPNEGNFEIRWIDPMQSEYSNIYICSQEGKIVFNGSMLREQLTKYFDLSHITPGLYILTLSRSNIITTKTFIKR